MKSSWPPTSLPRKTLLAIQEGKHQYTWRGVPCQKDPFDLALYPLLLWRERPRTIIEIGTKYGGSALWFSDTCRALGLETRIITIDIKKREIPSAANVEFIHGNGRNLANALPQALMRSIERPLLVIEDADHHSATTLAVLTFMDNYLLPGEYIVVEDGIIESLHDDTGRYGGGPQQAIEQFLKQHAHYEVDRSYCDFFGVNVTWNTNGFIRRLPRSRPSLSTL